MNDQIHMPAGNAISYRVIRSQRKTIALQITATGQVVVRCPWRASQQDIEAFVQSNTDWLRKHLPARIAQSQLPPLTMDDIHRLANAATKVIPERVKYFAPLVGVSYGNITIRNQRSRWGSCSSDGNLNFNCLLMLTPPEVLDYVVVHELCHRREMNHSPRFWAEVRRVMPDYERHRAWLKEHGGVLIARMTG